MDNNKSVRVIHLLNKKSNYNPPDYVYIGRPSLFGNPFSHLPDSKAQIIVDTRDESILKFREWLWGWDFLDFEQEKRWTILNNLEKLRGKTLGCWCKPYSCHGDVLKEILDNWDKKVQ